MEILRKDKRNRRFRDCSWDCLVNLHAQRSGKSASSRFSPCAQSTITHMLPSDVVDR